MLDPVRFAISSATASLLQTASENRRILASFLRELGERGFPLDQPRYAAAKRALTRPQGDLQLRNASATGSLAEGLEETLTLHRLGVAAELRVSFKPRNLIESVTARLEAKPHRITRWRTSDQKLRVCAAALWTMERQFRRVKGHRQPFLPKQALTTKLVSSPAAAA